MAWENNRPVIRLLAAWCFACVQMGILRGSFYPETRRPAIFSMKALPFGASNSVYSFLRVAHSLVAWLQGLATDLEQLL